MTPKAPPAIVVIGDANQGKTSLIRALLAEEDLGTIKDEAGTTKTREKNQAFHDGQPVFELFDNPGFECSADVRLNLQKSEEKISPAIIVQECIRQKENAATQWQKNAWGREQAAWESVEKCDVILWVMDVRKAPAASALPDTAYLLARSKKYVIPVFNFLPKEKRRETLDDYRKEITEMLTDYNLQSLICEYDTNRRDFHNEIDLLAAISISLKSCPDGYKRFKTYVKRREEKERLRIENACMDICDALLSLACYAEKKQNVLDNNVQQEEETLRKRYIENITRFEKKVFNKIIKHWNYEEADAVLDCQFTPLSAEITHRNHTLTDVLAWIGVKSFFDQFSGREVSVITTTDSLHKLCARLIDLTNVIRTRSKAVMQSNKPILKDRQILIPPETLYALWVFGSQNRTSTLNQEEVNAGDRKALQQVRLQLMSFLTQQIEFS